MVFLWWLINQTLKTTFNEEVKGFHFYEVDFCFRNFLEGVKYRCFYDVRITHKSIGMTNEQWEKTDNNLPKHIKIILPVLLPTSFTKKEVKKNEPLVTLQCQFTITQND
jgi:hypothetical protein